MNKYSKGDWTNCRYDICEILKNEEVFCTVATDDVDLVIAMFEEREELIIREKNCKKELEELQDLNKSLNERINMLEGLLIDTGLM